MNHHPPGEQGPAGPQSSTDPPTAQGSTTTARSDARAERGSAWMRLFRMDEFPVDGFTSSRHLSPWTLLAVRSLLLLYGIPVFILSGVATIDAYAFFTYFTVLSYLGILLYLVFACYLTYCVARHGVNPLHRVPPGWRLALWLLYSSIATYHLVVPLVFWVLLSRPLVTSGSASRWYTYFSMHALDVVFVYAEVFLNRAHLSFRWAHCATVLAVVVLYVFWAWIYFAATQRWVYTFLSFSTPLNAAFYVGVFLVFWGAFYLAAWIHVWRDRWYARGRSTAPTTAPSPTPAVQMVELPR